MYRVQGLAVCVAARKIVQAASRHRRAYGTTISRKLRRNSATHSGGFEYRGSCQRHAYVVTAQWYANRAAKRHRIAKLVKNLAWRNPEHSVGQSDNIRPPDPEYPATPGMPS